MVGVPVKVPSEFNVSPVWNDPDCTAQVYGAVPPAAANAVTYGIFCVPVGRGDKLVMESSAAGGSIMIVNPRVPVRAVGEVESVTVMVKSYVPATVGVPVIAPVDEFRVNPVGSVPIVVAYEYGVVPPVEKMD